MRPICLIVLGLALPGCQPATRPADSDPSAETDSSVDDDEPAPPLPDSEDPPETPDEDPGDSSGFIPHTDAGDQIPSCDPWDLDSCGPGQKCTGYSPLGSGIWDYTRCVPIAEDAKAIGESCTYDGSFEDGFDDCEKGAVCWDAMLLQGQEVGTCVPICVGSSNDPSCADGENYVCNLSKAAIGLCLPRCNPVETECPLGCTCVSDPGGSGFVCITDASGDGGAYGDECTYLNSCDPTLFCANADFVPGCDGSNGCCSYFCDVEDPEACAQVGTECIPWFEEGQAPVGFEHVGGCGVAG